MKDEVEYKNKQLTSKDTEIEAHKKATGDRIIQLEARVKELEGKISEASPNVA